MIRTLHRPLVAVLLALLAVSTSASFYAGTSEAAGTAAEVTIAQDVGLSAERLLRIDQVVQTPGGPLRADFQNAVMQAIID